MITQEIIGALMLGALGAAFLAAGSVAVTYLMNRAIGWKGCVLFWGIIVWTVIGAYLLTEGQ